MATNTLDELIIASAPSTPDEILMFTEGDCWKLAYELHNRGVGRIVGIVDRVEIDDWCHMAVKLDDGTFLDAFGVSTREQLLQRWSQFCGSKVGVIVEYNIEVPGVWQDLTEDQESGISYPKDLQVLADKLQGWLEEL